METVFERDVLYQKVWDTPISKLAKTYGLSDNGLRKICIALSIPIPPRGHWQKLAAGKAIKRPALPKSKGPTQFFSNLTPPLIGAEESGPAEPSPDAFWLRERLAFEKDPANAIVVPAELQDPHPAIAKAAKVLATKIASLDKARIEWNIRRVRRPGERWQPELMSSVGPGLHEFYRLGQVIDLLEVPLRVSAHTADRALRIWDALIKACARRGIGLSPHGLFTVPGYAEQTHLRLTERVTPKKGDEDKSSPTVDSFAMHANKRPTGELRIMIGEGFECVVVDRPSQPLETQLNGVIARACRQIVANKAREDRWREDAIVRAAEKARSEEARLLQMEQERLIAEERERQEDLAEESESWAQSAKITAYVANVIATATATGAPLGADLQRWVEWATGVAKEMDPTKKRIAE